MPQIRSRSILPSKSEDWLQKYRTELVRADAQERKAEHHPASKLWRERIVPAGGAVAAAAASEKLPI